MWQNDIFPKHIEPPLMKGPEVKAYNGPWAAGPELMVAGVLAGTGIYFLMGKDEIHVWQASTRIDDSSVNYFRTLLDFARLKCTGAQSLYL